MSRYERNTNKAYVSYNASVDKRYKIRVEIHRENVYQQFPEGASFEAKDMNEKMRGLHLNTRFLWPSCVMLNCD